MARIKYLLGDKPYELPKPPAERAFDGSTYEAPRDYVRLNGQMLRVFNVMKDGNWRTLQKIVDSIEHGSEPAVSARLRDFRKPKYGGHTVERRSVGGGLFEYRLIVRGPYRGE